MKKITTFILTMVITFAILCTSNFSAFAENEYIPVEFGVTYTSNIIEGTNNRDYYQIDAPSTAKVTVEFTMSNPNVGLEVGLYDSAQVYLIECRPLGYQSSEVFWLEKGTYYLKVNLAEGDVEYSMKVMYEDHSNDFSTEYIAFPCGPGTVFDYDTFYAENAVQLIPNKKLYRVSTESLAGHPYGFDLPCRKRMDIVITADADDYYDLEIFNNSFNYKSRLFSKEIRVSPGQESVTTFSFESSCVNYILINNMTGPYTIELREHQEDRKGWNTENGKTYYYKNGIPVKYRQKIDGKWYYFNGAGVMQRNGWIKGSNWFYADKNGVLKTGLQTIDGRKYCFNSSGAAQKGWQTIIGKTYYFNNSYQAVIWRNKINNKWYYFNGSGVLQKNDWIRGKYWFYADAFGVLKTGWAKMSNKWYYFNAKGEMLTGWQKIGGKWYYLNSSGSMRTANLKQGGKTYRFNKNGVCLNP